MTSGAEALRTASNSARAAGSAARAAAWSRPRSTRCLTTSSSPALARSSSRATRRERSSPAALRVNVIARISCGRAPARSKRTMRPTRSQVLPLPAQASTTTLCCGSSAALANVIAPTARPSRNSAAAELGVSCASLIRTSYPCGTGRAHRNAHKSIARRAPAAPRRSQAARIHRRCGFPARRPARRDRP